MCDYVNIRYKELFGLEGQLQETIKTRLRHRRSRHPAKHTHKRTVISYKYKCHRL